MADLKGPRGLPGVIGITGPRGNQGNQGFEGHQGEQGEPGERGPKAKVSWGDVFERVGLFVICVLLVIFVFRSQSQYATNERQDRSEIATCKRVKTVRHQANVALFIEWRLLTNAAVRERALAKTDGTRGARAAHLKSARQLEDLVSEAKFSPQTDCNQAIKDPLGYRPPKPRPFSELKGPLP